MKTLDVKRFREGQVWEETMFPLEDLKERPVYVWLVLGREEGRGRPSWPAAYRLVNLETGDLDWVASRRIDNPDVGWRRIG